MPAHRRTLSAPRRPPAAAARALLSQRPGSLAELLQSLLASNIHTCSGKGPGKTAPSPAPWRPGHLPREHPSARVSLAQGGLPGQSARLDRLCPPPPSPFQHPPSMPVTCHVITRSRGGGAAAARTVLRGKGRANEMSVLFIEAPALRAARPAERRRRMAARRAGKVLAVEHHLPGGMTEGSGGWGGIFCSGVGALFLLGEHELRRAPQGPGLWLLHFASPGEGGRSAHV